MTGKLKKLCLCFVAGAVLIFGGLDASADTYYGNSNWQVTFTDKLEENFDSGEITDVFRGLQPGDNAVVTIKLVNKNAKSTDWYMRNDVITSMEDGSSVAEGGAYTYKLTYKDKTGKEKILYDSEKVGGDNSGTIGEGLHGATGALKDFFFLDSLTTNQSGAVTLEVAFDGESHINDYQNTLADLQMNFAVELGATNNQTGNRTQVVRTGDDTELLPLYAAMALSGVVLLALGIYSFRKDKRKRGE